MNEDDSNKAPAIGRTTPDAVVEVATTVLSLLGRAAPVLILFAAAYFAYETGRSEQEKRLDQAATRVSSMYSDLADGMKTQIGSVKSAAELALDVTARLHATATKDNETRTELALREQELARRVLDIQRRELEISQLNTDLKKMSMWIVDGTGLEYSSTNRDKLKALAHVYFQRSADEIVSVIHQIATGPQLDGNALGGALAGVRYDEVRQKIIDAQGAGFDSWVHGSGSIRGANGAFLLGMKSLGPGRLRWLSIGPASDGGRVSSEALATGIVCLLEVPQNTNYDSFSRFIYRPEEFFRQRITPAGDRAPIDSFEAAKFCRPAASDKYTSVIGKDFPLSAEPALAILARHPLGNDWARHASMNSNNPEQWAIHLYLQMHAPASRVALFDKIKERLKEGLTPEQDIDSIFEKLMSDSQISRDRDNFLWFLGGDRFGYLESKLAEDQDIGSHRSLKVVSQDGQIEPPLSQVAAIVNSDGRVHYRSVSQ